MGWLELVGSIKLQVSFPEYRLFYRALLQKRPIILSILLTVATPYSSGWSLPLTHTTHTQHTQHIHECITYRTRHARKHITYHICVFVCMLGVLVMGHTCVFVCMLGVLVMGH